MTASQSRKSARRTRCRSIGHSRTRPDFPPPMQIVGQLVEFDLIRPAFVSRFTVAQLVASARSSSDSLPAALKSP
jgi:hypothetical protein